MTRERSVTLAMPAGEPHCEPSAACVVRGRCLRHIARPSKGGAPHDYSAEAGGGTAVCPGFWLLSHILAAPRRASGAR